MDEVNELLKTWELPDLIPVFQEQGITLQALSALTVEDLKDLIPKTGPRVLFTRCWKTWKNEFSPNTTNDTSLNNISFSDFSNFDLGLQNEELKDPEQETCIIIPLTNDTQKENLTPTLQQVPIQTEKVTEPQCGILENLLKQSLETSALLIYKGGSLDGDSTRNLLASVIAREILNENKNSPIVGQIYFKWTKFIKELFPGERTTTYYIPACTTASGVNLQSRGKLVHQVLNKRRRLQQLGSLTTNKKRIREDSPGPSCHRPLPGNVTSDVINSNEDDLLWLQNSSEPWNLVEIKWKLTMKTRVNDLRNKKHLSIESYIQQYPALKKPLGYILLNNDFADIYTENTENLYNFFPVAKNKIIQLIKQKIKDNYRQEILSLAESSKEEHQNLAAFLAIPHLLNTSTIKQKKRKEVAGSNWKPSKAETRDAFIKHVRSDAEIGPAIQLRLKTLINKGVSPQPYVMIVGESLHDIKTFLVVVNASVIYQVANILQAVDTCYKAIWSLNLEYGSDSYAIWYFIQRGIYKMTSESDRGSTTAESLLTDCNF